MKDFIGPSKTGHLRTSRGGKREQRFGGKKTHSIGMSLVCMQNRKDADFGETWVNVKEQKNKRLMRMEEPYRGRLVSHNSMHKESYGNE